MTAVSPAYTSVHAHTRTHNFESHIPRGVLLMMEDGKISIGVYSLIGCLLDYKSKGGSTVEPMIRTLAARLRKSTRTIRRWIDEAEAAGLIATKMNRDARGRIKSLLFDLSNIFAMGVKKARAAASHFSSRVTSVSTSANVGEPTTYAQIGSEEHAEAGSPVDMGVRESYKQDIAEQAKPTADDLTGADALSFKALREFKMRPDAAVRFALARGPVIIGAAIKRLRKAMNRDRIGTPAGYLVRLLEDDAFVEEVLAGLTPDTGIREYVGGKPVEKQAPAPPTASPAPVPPGGYDPAPFDLPAKVDIGLIRNLSARYGPQRVAQTLNRRTQELTRSGQGAPFWSLGLCGRMAKGEMP